MRATDAWRAKLLVDALDQWADFEKELKRTKGRTQEHRAFEMQAGDLETEGLQPDAYIFVDDQTGRLIAEAAKKIIADELARLGIELEDEPGATAESFNKGV